MVRAFFLLWLSQRLSALEGQLDWSNLWSDYIFCVSVDQCPRAPSILFSSIKSTNRRRRPCTSQWKQSMDGLFSNAEYPHQPTYPSYAAPRISNPSIWRRKFLGGRLFQDGGFWNEASRSCRRNHAKSVIFVLERGPRDKLVPVESLQLSVYVSTLIIQCKDMGKNVLYTH